MIDELTKERIGWWIIKARGQRDPFVKFILYWFCFNAWLTSLSGKDNDALAIKWFKNNDSFIKTCVSGFWNSPETQSLLRGLKNDCPVYNNRQGQRGEFKSIYDVNNINEVIDVIYQIRGNLFHGTKNPRDPRESRLVENSSKILEKWIEWAQINS